MQYLKTKIDFGDTVVGIDQGIQRLVSNGIPFHYCIGDYDSFDVSLVNDPCTIIKLDAEKDFTDLEYGVRYFPDHEIFIINNLQGRIDHILGVIHLLELRHDIHIISASQEIHLVRKHYSANLPIGTTISLIPISEKVTNITTSGLYYRLDNETLYRKKSRGLSNKNVDNFIDVFFLDGELLIIINNGI